MSPCRRPRSAAGRPGPRGRPSRGRWRRRRRCARPRRPAGSGASYRSCRRTWGRGRPLGPALTASRRFRYDVRDTMATQPRDFYEVQKRQRRRSLFLFAAVLLFYFAAIGLLGLAFLASFGLVFNTGLLGSPSFWPRFLLFDLAGAAVACLLHFQDARANGP